MELTKFISSFKARLDAIGFDAEKVWDSAVTTACPSPEAAAEALLDFCRMNPHIDFVPDSDRYINKFAIIPGMKVREMGAPKFIKFMFMLGVVIQ